jgi:hypothetical protein
MANGYIVTVVNRSAYAQTIGRVTTADGINGTATNITLPSLGSLSFAVNSGANGYNILSRSLSNFFIGSFTRNLASSSGTQTVTGVGFQPRGVIFFAAVPSVVGAASWGLDDGTNSEGIRGGTVAGEFNTQTDGGSIEVVISGGNYQSASITTLNPDGFIVTWAKTGTPTGTATVKYLAMR